MSQVVNFSIDQGTDFIRILTFKTDLGVPINLTGFTFAGQARQNYSDSMAAFQFSFVVKDQITNTGEVEMRLPASQTNGLRLSQALPYVYDIERTSPGGLVDRIMQGVITLNPEATK